ARLALAHGDTAAAARWAQQRGLSPDGEPAYPRELDHLVLARVLLAQHQPQPALRLLGRLRAAAESQGRTGSIIEIGALRALALAATGGQAAAEELAGALALAAPQGYVRVFADEGPPMAALLGQVAAAHRDGQPAARQAPLGHLAAVLRACAPARRAPGTARSGPTSIPGLADPLTARETQVLHLLATGAPNQQIADDLVVTLDTVKKHITHLHGKLGAANRTAAAGRAPPARADPLAPPPRVTPRRSRAQSPRWAASPQLQRKPASCAGRREQPVFGRHAGGADPGDDQPKLLGYDGHP